MKYYYLIGIGGSGMNALAQVFIRQGAHVSGSDRSYDRGENKELFQKLKKIGVELYLQNGSGINRKIDKVIVSRAVENHNPDFLQAKKYQIPISYRQDELKNIFRKKSGIAVAGTCGKSTVVGMIGCILHNAGRRISVINGGIVKNYETKSDIGNVRISNNTIFIIETDESEGNLDGYFPKIAVLTNIGCDHVPENQLRKIYKKFINFAKERIIINNQIKIPVKRNISVSFGVFGDADLKPEEIKLYPNYSVFKLKNIKVRIGLPGLHNVENALASIAACRACGVSLEKCAEGVAKFKGIKRRFELVYKKDNIRVIDDFAHNPDKIQAALKTAKIADGRVIAIYQPHGYRPTKMFLNQLADVFTSCLSKNDFLFLPEIYFAGGTAEKDISSKDLVREIKKRNRFLRVKYVKNRIEILRIIDKIIKHGDTVLIMGARDNTLSDFAKQVAKLLKNRV